MSLLKRLGTTQDLAGNHGVGNARAHDSAPPANARASEATSSPPENGVRIRESRGESYGR
jgi:hypothetical protein